MAESYKVRVRGLGHAIRQMRLRKEIRKYLERIRLW